ncbi:hypothetical protein [Bremerella sp.]|uniref:hypothetical protein n=1 Tax=Bremerella sp. TaxID=2795602 RepID=UPI003919FFC6
MKTPPPFENDRYASPPSEPEPKPSTSPRKWYRFTLWKMVVAFVLLGVVFAYLRYTHWGYVLSESITRAGRSMGMTSQRDPNKIYVSAVRPLESDDWEWSVQIPRSEIYSVCIRVHDIPVQVDKDELAKIGHVVLSWNYLVNVYAASDWDSAGGLDGISHVIHDYNGMMPSYDSSAWSGTGDLSWLNGSVE